jgi:hypothetical protein
MFLLLVLFFFFEIGAPVQKEEEYRLTATLLALRI